jgi:hypothetical protein
MKRLARQYLNFAPQLSVMARRHSLLRRASASELLSVALPEMPAVSRCIRI